MLAGFSGSLLALDDSGSSLLASRFTRQPNREVQLFLDILLLAVLEIHDLLTLISFGPSVPVPGLAYLFAPPFGLECLTSLADVMT